MADHDGHRENHFSRQAVRDTIHLALERIINHLYHAGVTHFIGEGIIHKNGKRIRYILIEEEDEDDSARH
jgi:hypothetical protein